MKQLFVDFFREVLSGYRERCAGFWVILYATAALSELFRQMLLERLVGVGFFVFPADVAFQALMGESVFFIGGVALLFLATILAAIWGFAALFVFFSKEMSLGASFIAGLKKLPKYTLYVLIASALTLVGLVIITAPATFMLNRVGIQLPTLLADTESYFTTLPLLLFLMLPGIYLLVSFSNGPFILLLEKRGIIASLRESHRRVWGAWRKVLILLFVSFLIAAAVYFLLSRLIFSLKLALIPDQPFQIESMFSVFLYSIPWVVVASFYDYALYRLYLRLRDDMRNRPTTDSSDKNVIMPDKLSAW